MTTTGGHRILFGGAIIAALVAALLVFYADTAPSVFTKTTITVEQSALDTSEQPPASTCAVIDVMAYIRSDQRLLAGDVQWLFSVSRDNATFAYECYFEPQSTVDNLAMSNPDGSEYFVGMMKGRIFLRKSADLRSVSYELPSPYLSPDSLEIPASPTIIIEGNLSASGFNIEWTTANLPANSCRVLFKYLEQQQDDPGLPLICLLDSYSI